MDIGNTNYLTAMLPDKSVDRDSTFNSSLLAVLRVMSLCALVDVVFFKKIDISDEHPHPRG